SCKNCCFLSADDRKARNGSARPNSLCCSSSSKKANTLNSRATTNISTKLHNINADQNADSTQLLLLCSNECSAKNRYTVPATIPSAVLTEETSNHLFFITTSTPFC